MYKPTNIDPSLNKLCQTKDTDITTAAGTLTPTSFFTGYEWYEKQTYFDPGLRSAADDTHGQHNYCRNPSGAKSTIWCQTKTSPFWDYCDPKLLPEIITDPFTFTIICKPYVNSKGDNEIRYKLNKYQTSGFFLPLNSYL